MFFAKHLNIDKHFLFLGDKIPQIEQTPDQYKGKQNIIDETLRNFLKSN